jgi:hypothetical protein
MVVERLIPIENEQRRPYPVYQAAPLLGLTETALRAQIFRGRVNVIKLGKRTMISKLEIARLSGLSA